MLFFDAICLQPLSIKCDVITRKIFWYILYCYWEQITCELTSLTYCIICVSLVSLFHSLSSKNCVWWMHMARAYRTIYFREKGMCMCHIWTQIAYRYMFCCKKKRTLPLDYRIRIHSYSWTCIICLPIHPYQLNRPIHSCMCL